MAVANIIVMDPDNERVWRFDKGNLQLAAVNPLELRLPERNASLALPLPEMFAELDED